MKLNKVVIIGAGIGGLTTAALLARAGLNVTLLEAHVYPGGCAGTFYHKGYRFDAGATLAGGFYPGGPMDLVARSVGIDRWPARPSNPAMTVHLPGGAAVTRWTGPERWQERRRAFGPQADLFWRWQEATADALWDLALRQPAWPPQTLREAGKLAGQGLSWLLADLRRASPRLAADAIRPVAAHLRDAPEFPAALRRCPASDRRSDDQPARQRPVRRISARSAAARRRASGGRDGRHRRDAGGGCTPERR